MSERFPRPGGPPRGVATLRSPAALRPLQELEQQLMMEKRNYRKTLKFYQKLLQKEKRSKGSACAPGLHGRHGAPRPGRLR